MWLTDFNHKQCMKGKNLDIVLLCCGWTDEVLGVAEVGSVVFVVKLLLLLLQLGGVLML